MATAQFTLYAQRLLGIGKASDAVTVLEEGLKEFPEYATAYALLARAYLQLHDIPTAYEVAAHAIQRFPYHRGLALLYQQLSDLLHASSDSQTVAAPPQDNTTPSDSSPSPQATHHASEHRLTENLSEPPLPADKQAVAEGDKTAGIDLAIIYPHATEPDPSNNETLVQTTEIPTKEQLTADTDFSSASAEEDTTTVESAGKSAESSTPPQQKITSASVLPEGAQHHTMRLIETAMIDRRAMRMLRSSNIRLIPGLEFAPLRIEITRQKETTHAVMFPPFRPIRGVQTSNAQLRSAIPTTPAALEAELQRRTSQRPEIFEEKTSLELLAEQLERARIKSPEVPTPSPADTTIETEEPTVVTETMASIYERQGAIEQAIKAYTILARLNPDRRSYFEEKIAQLRAR